MGSYLKKNWKWFGIGLAVIVVIVIALLIFRVMSFVGDLTANRVGAATPTADTQAQSMATITAEARRCAASASCTTIAAPGTGQLIPTPTILATTPTPAATATPNFSSSKIVQRIKAGDRITAMYMGYGGSGHEGAYLTDSVLVLSYDPKSLTVTQFNIPRDLYVSVPGGPGGKTFKAKMNGVFATIMSWDKSTQDDLDPKYRWTNPKQQLEAAANLSANTVQNVLGIPIDYWIVMNFDGFRSLIDKIGGVNVCVDRAFVDNEYPRNDNDQVDASVMTVKFDKGCQVMSGDRAIQFARSRKSKTIGEEGDFARSARQMKVVAALKEDVLKKNLIVNGLSYMDALQGNLRVSMEPDELLALANYFNGEGKSTLTDIKFDPEIMTGNNFLQETDKGGAIGYAIIPQAGEDKYSDIHSWVKSDFNFALIRRENVRLQVLNGSGITGKGNALADFLQDQGFRQAEADSGILRDETTLYDYSNGAATANINQLKQFLPNLKVVTSTPDKKPPDNVPDLVLYLYLGKDYKGVANTTGGQGGAVPTTAKP